MPSTLEELLGALAEYVGQDKDKARELALAIHKKDETQPIAQVLVNRGMTKRTADVSGKLAEMESTIGTLTEDLEQAHADLETAKAKPNEQQAAWDREKQKLVTRAEKAEGERDTERTNRKGDAVKLSRAAFLTALKGRVDDFGLKAVANEFGERFRPRDDGGVDVLDDDGDPIEPPKGQTAEALLAERAFETVPASNRQRQMNTGAGLGGGGSNTVVTAEELGTEKAQSGQYRM